MNLPPKSSFVPLNGGAPASHDRADFRVTVVKQASNLRPFQSLGHPSPGAPGKPGCEPTVTVQKDGDRVSGIQIQCSCGQVIELSCVYSPG